MVFRGMRVLAIGAGLSLALVRSAAADTAATTLAPPPAAPGPSAAEPPASAETPRGPPRVQVRFLGTSVTVSTAHAYRPPDFDGPALGSGVDPADFPPGPSRDPVEVDRPPPRPGPESSPDAAISPDLPRNEFDLAALTGEAPLSGPVEAPADFTDRLREVYGISDGALVADVWALARLDPPDLGLAERSGNAVHRYAVGIPPGGSFGPLTRRPLPDAGSRGPVRARLGLQLRVAGFGPATGTIRAGDRVAVLACAPSAWCEVRRETDGVAGWVSGIFLDIGQN